MGRRHRHHLVECYMQESPLSTGQVRAVPDGLRSIRVAAINVGDRVPGALNKDGQDDLETTSLNVTCHKQGMSCQLGALPWHPCAHVFEGEHFGGEAAWHASRQGCLQAIQVQNPSPGHRRSCKGLLATWRKYYGGARCERRARAFQEVSCHPQSHCQGRRVLNSQSLTFFQRLYPSPVLEPPPPCWRTLPLNDSVLL